MYLASAIMHFFSHKNIRRENEIGVPRTILEFQNQYPKSNMTEVEIICKKLINLGYMTDWTSALTPPSHVFSKSYLASLKEPFFSYGMYDFLIHGLLVVRNHFENSVKAVVVTKSDDDLDIGTSFLAELGGKKFILTALHCIEKMKNVCIKDENGKPIKAKNIFISTDEMRDIAIIEYEGSILENIPHLQFGQAQILDEVLMMGYPPLNGFDSLLISEKATINTILKSSSGNVVGKGESYLDKQDYILINAKVKGGNSGGPIIGTSGNIAGMLVQIPTDSKNPNQLDKLGYGVGIPSMVIAELVADALLRNNTGTSKKLKFKNSEKGFSTFFS